VESADKRGSFGPFYRPSEHGDVFYPL
jgi:hypothetical protein